MSFKRTLFYALLLGVLGFYIYKVEIPKEKAEARKELLFPDLSRNAIERIEIRKGGETIALVNSEPGKDASRDDDGAFEEPLRAEKWGIEGLPGAAVDSAGLSSLVSAVKALRLDGAVPADEVEKDGAVYGLADPALVVSVKLPGETKEIQFGKMNEYVSKRYSKVSGRQDLYLISDGLFSVANKGRNDFRSRTPVSFLDADVKTAIFEGGGSKTVLESPEPGEWRLKEPIEAPAGAASVSELLRAVKNLRVEKFVDGQDEELAGFGLDDPALRVLIEPRDALKKEPIEILIGVRTVEEGADDSEGTSYYFKLASKPGIHELSSDPRPQLSRSADSLREKRLLSFGLEKVTKAHFEPKEGEKIALSKEEAGWLVNGKAGDDAFVREVLNNLSNLEAVAFPPAGAATGFDSPKLVVSLELKGDPSERKLVIGASTEHSGKPAYFAGVDDLSVPFVVTDETFRKIFVKEEALLPVQPVAIPAASAAADAGAGGSAAADATQPTDPAGSAAGS